MTDNEFLARTMQQLDESPLAWYERLANIRSLSNSHGAVRILLEQRERALQAAARDFIDRESVRIVDDYVSIHDDGFGCELRLYPKDHRCAPYAIIDTLKNKGIVSTISRRQARDFLMCLTESKSPEAAEVRLTAAEHLLVGIRK